MSGPDADPRDTVTVSTRALGVLAALAHATLPGLVASAPSSPRTFELAAALTEAERAIQHAGEGDGGEQVAGRR